MKQWGSQSIVLYTKARAFPVSFAIQGRFLAPQTTLSLFQTGSVHRVFSLTFRCFYGAGSHQIIPAALRVADIVQLNGNIRPRSRQWWQLFRMVSQWHVDVVIVERRSFSIVAAVELDDASHLRPERRRRDILLEEVLRQAGIPLLRSHDARKLLQMTGEWLNTTGAD